MSKKSAHCIGLIILLILLLTDSRQLIAQFNSMVGESAPVSLGIQYDYYDPARLNQFVARFGMTQYADFIPKGSPFAETTSLGLAGGVRFGSDSETIFRWRLTLFEGDIPFRNFFIFGISALDIDKISRLEEDYVLAVGRIGVAPVLGGKTFLFTPRVVGTIGGGSLVLGQANYSDLAVADTLDTFIRLSGLQLGFKAGAALRIKQRIILLADYVDRTLFDGTEPRFQTLSGEVRWVIGSPQRAFRFFVRYEYEKAKLNKLPREQENNNVIAGMIYTFQRQNKRKWF